MNNWDKANKFMEDAVKNSSKWSDQLKQGKNRVVYLMDKHQVIKKLFIIGIAFNFYLMYQKSSRYFQISELNEKILKNQQQFRDRLTVRKYQLLDAT